MDRLRVFVAAALGAAAGIFAVAIGMGLTGSLLVAPLLAVACAVVTGALLLTRPILPLDVSACPRGLRILSAVATVGALVVLARLAVFMVAPSQVAYSSIPGSAWETEHSCVTAYYVAARAASTTPDVYSNSLYTASDDDPAKPRKPLMMGQFRIDVFEYPPPFLLLPRAMRWLTPEFLPFRTLWFGLNGAFVLAVMIVVTRTLGSAVGTRALLLLPLVWISIPMMSLVQKGNVQAAVLAASMLAMVLFERRHWGAGGALLAFATVSKLYPGLLVIYLIARREWRAVAWTGAIAVVLVLATAGDIGLGSYEAFARHLPGLMSGEAFPAFRNPMSVAINFSIPGLLFKLKLFGVPGMTFEVSRLVGWAYSLLAATVTVILALRVQRADERPLIWLAVLILATLRSPFLPQAYAAFPALWLLTLVAARFVPSPKVLGLIVLAWAGLSIMWPVDWKLDPRWLVVLSGIPQSASILLTGWIVRRGLRSPSVMRPALGP